METISSGSDFVDVLITTSKDEKAFNQRRFSKDLTIEDLKIKLELITGGDSKTMKVEVFNKENALVCVLGPSEALLGSFPLNDGVRLHVVDRFLLHDFSEGSIPKFELSDEKYSQRNDTVKAFLMKNKQGIYNPGNQKKLAEQEEQEMRFLEKIELGARCKVVVNEGPVKFGTVMFKGFVEVLNGRFVGVKYDEPLGKHNGTVKGVKYFECPDKYGAFVRPFSVEIGDFPEETYDLEDEI